MEFVEDPISGIVVLLSCCTFLKNAILRIEEKLRETSGEMKLARNRVLAPMMAHYHMEEEVEIEVMKISASCISRWLIWGGDSMVRTSLL